MRPERARDAAVMEAYKAGETIAEIAKRFGISPITVHATRRRTGTPKRGRAHLRGERSPSWLGGRTTDKDGYVKVRMADGSRQREHRLVMEAAIGRPLETYETVHHLNGDRSDNRLENLQLRTGRHGKGIANRCRSCGSCDIESTEV